MAQYENFEVRVLRHDDVFGDAVLQHWSTAWHQYQLRADWQEQISTFLRNASESELQPRTFVATDSEGALLGSLRCQIWAGPIPKAVQPQVFRLGTVWGLHVGKTAESLATNIRRELLKRALLHLKSCLCGKVVTLVHSEAEKQNVIEAGVGFESANMLTLDLMQEEAWKKDQPSDHQFVCSSAGPEHDETVTSHWKKMWLDVGIPENAMLPDMEQRTSTFIKEARDRLSYQSFLARCTKTQKVVGSLACQVWEGPFPKIAQPEAFQMGTIWAVYVDPQYRRMGVATALMKLALQHLRTAGCHSAILVAASEGGQCVYERLGFRANNALVCDIGQLARSGTDKTLNEIASDFTSEEKKQEDASCAASDQAFLQELRRALCDFLDVPINDWQALALSTATSQQLAAVYHDQKHGAAIVEAVVSLQKEFGTYIDPTDNWFTQRLAKAKETSFGGGFNMKQLSDPGNLASKFDRLATRYDEWTVGNRSKVESFIVRCAREAASIRHDSGRDARVLDVACGIGLQGQVLRMLGFQGELVGTDISSGMVKRAMERGCYDQVYVADANKGMSNPNDNQVSYDVVICTGAIELMQARTALCHISSMTKPEGEVWLSFQLDKGANPCQHQGVKGITEQEAVDLLDEAGFGDIILEACPDAFYTPSPAQDGTLLAVPYLFVVAKKKGSGDA